MRDSAPASERQGLQDAIARKRDELRAIEQRRAAVERELRRLEADVPGRKNHETRMSPDDAG